MSDKKTPKLELHSNVVTMQKKEIGGEEIAAILQHLASQIDDLSNLMVAYTDKNGISYVLFSPMTGAVAAYLSKQVDAEFMANFMFAEDMCE